MCLGTVARVVDVVDGGRAVVEHAAVRRGTVEQTGRREDVLKMTIDDELRPGDWVVIHSGFVLERISEARAFDALAIRATPPDTTPRDTTDSHTTVPSTTPGASAAPQHKEVAL